MKSSGLRLGFHYHTPAILKGGGIYVPGAIGCFIDSLAPHFEEVVCFLHTPHSFEKEFLNYKIRTPNVHLVSIGFHASVPYRLIFSRQFTGPIRDRRKDIDLLLIRGPSPLLPAVAQAGKGVPLVLLLVGNYLDGIGDLPQPGWRKQLIYLWGKWNFKQQMEVAKRSLVFVNSRKLHDELQGIVPDLIETQTTTLGKKDFFEREDTCQKPPYRLLYTGRIERTKGLFEIATALTLLMEQGDDVVLDLVGSPEKNENSLEDLRAFAQNKGVVDRIKYHGFKSLGPELFAYYKQADIYVIASYHEGFPRTIWEAMAHSLPVVATKVGSIPHFLHDQEDVLLVSPYNSIELAQSIKRLIHEPQLRQQLIRRGIELARENTLEKRAEEMVFHIRRWLEK